MARLKRDKKGVIDVLEHAMRGVQTSENRGRIVRFHAERGIVGLRSETGGRPIDDLQQEREVVVKMPRPPTSRRSRD